MLIKDMGSGPNPMEVIPEKDLSTSMSALPAHLFSGTSIQERAALKHRIWISQGQVGSGQKRPVTKG